MNNNFESYIQEYFQNNKSCIINDAMIYAMDGGKRFRARLIFALLKGFGISENDGYDAALGLELIQSYSLIHDDLPAMDNDDLRRGKPTVHKAYGEDIAILAGDELLTESFGVIADSKNLDAETKVKIISAMSKYAGLSGMVYGQLLDITSNGKKLDDNMLFEIQDNKTSGLFKIACLMACYVAKEKDENYFIKLGSLIGEIFQNQDDLFDLIKSEEELGKSKSDVKNDKATALTVHSIDELKKIIDDEFKYLDGYLSFYNFDSSYLKDLLNELRKR